jgi:competence protein ComEC
MGQAPSIASAAGERGQAGVSAVLEIAVERWLERQRDNLVLWLPVALGAGAAGWFVLPGPLAWLTLIQLSAGCGLLLLVLRPGRRWTRVGAIAALLVAVGAGLAWTRAEMVRAPRLDRTIVARFEGHVIGIEPQPAHERTRLTLRPRAAPGLPPRIRVNVAPRDMPDALTAGALVRVRARLLPPAPPAVPGAYDFARAAWFQGLGATGRALGPVEVIEAGRGGGRIAAIRRAMSARAQAALPGSAGGIAAALATGDTGGIMPEDVEAMRRSGLAHLLSISGLHVTAVVAAAVLATVRLLALSPALALRWPLPLIGGAAGAGAAIGYTVLSGGEVPTVRSCIAALLVLAGLALGREAITLRLVATGAFVVLLLWPEAIVSPSFQLSFAAVTTIVALHRLPIVASLVGPRDENWAAGGARKLGGLLLTGLGIELALAPIALFHFHKAGLYGAVANIVAIPLTTFVVMPAEALAFALDFVGLGRPAWWIAGVGLDLLLWVAHRVAGAPGAVAALPAMPAGAFALMIAGGLWLCLWQGRSALAGLVPFAMGAAWAAATPPPDLVITGDGRHLGLVDRSGRLRLLRDRAGSYVIESLGQAAGQEQPFLLTGGEDASCSADLCLARIGKEPPLRLLATRSAYPVPWGDLVEHCRAADVAVSDRRLPAACRPRWLKLDRPALALTGGIAITAASGRVVTVHRPGDRHPWSLATPRPARPRSAAPSSTPAARMKAVPASGNHGRSPTDAA